MIKRSRRKTGSSALDNESGRMAPSPAGQLPGSLQFSLKKASEWKMQMWSRVLKTFEVLNSNTLGTKFKQQAQHFDL